jgi:hypothetical protein
MTHRAAHNIARAFLCNLVFCVTVAGGGNFGSNANCLWAQLDHEREPVSYSKRSPTDPVAQFKSKLESGSAILVWQAEHGYLKSLLDQLNVPTESQVLVFSKTSLQATKISPATPRAIYFSSDVYIGWVPDGELIEIAATDRELGGVFYSLKQRADRPELSREISRCIQCHGSTHTRRVPGPFVRSVYCDEQGHPQLNLGSFVTTDKSPMKDRWGGWYVTGQHGRQQHMGNNLVRSATHGETPMDLRLGANRTELSKFFDTSRYLSAHSDIVALMVLEHQTTVQNVLTHAGHTALLAGHEAESMNKLLDRPEDFEPESITRRFDSAAEQVVRALLMEDAVLLTDSIVGTSDFTKSFQSLGPFDDKGRSLRELDLQKRLFRFRCSFLIYSDQFRSLPVAVMQRVIDRLKQILKDRSDPPAEFPSLSHEDRQEILDILSSTGFEQLNPPAR